MQSQEKELDNILKKNGESDLKYGMIDYRKTKTKLASKTIHATTVLVA